MSEPRHWCTYCQAGSCERHSYEKEVPKPETAKPEPEPDQARKLAETEEQLLRVQAERAADRFLHQLRVAQAQEPQRQRQLAADRKTFSDAARQYGIGDTEANFRLVRENV